MEKTVRVELVSLDGKKSQGEVRTQYWDKKERTARAFKFLGLCWGIALVSIIFPLIHFVVPPLFLLAGPIVAFFMYQQTNVVLGGSAPCPRCGKDFQVARTRIQWPLNDICAECHNAVKIFPLEQAEASPNLPPAESHV
jgi:hypothetical protein